MKNRKKLLHHSFNKKKGAISAIIGGIFVFLIVFSVVAAYFVFDYNAGTSVNLAANEQALRNAQALSQNYTITQIYQSYCAKLCVNVTNLGPDAIQIASVFTLNYTTGNIIAVNNLLCSAPCTPQMVAINPGNWTILDTNFTWTGQVVLIKVTTTLGRSEATLYPPSAATSGGGPFASLESQTIGDIFLDFHSYSFYNVTQSGCSGTRGPLDSTYCLGAPKQAFTICCGTNQGNLTQQPIAFSVRVRNVNPNFLNITLDGYSQFFQFFPQGSSLRSVYWYIISVDSNGYIENNYDPQSGFLPNTFNQTTAPEVTLYFANGNPGGAFQTVLPKASQALPAPELVSIFIFAHGWKGNGTSSPNLISKVGEQNFGQNIPFVTTKYCDSQSDVACYT